MTDRSKGRKLAVDNIFKSMERVFIFFLFLFFISFLKFISFSFPLLD